MSAVPSYARSDGAIAYRWRTLLAGVCLALGLVQGAHAHKGSDAYLDVQSTVPAAGSSALPVADLRLMLSVALRDLDQVVAIDADGDARITWGEVQAATPALLEQLDRDVQMEFTPARTTGDGARSRCGVQWQRDGLEQRSDGAYFRAVSTVQCSRDGALALRYRLFRAQDAGHRLLVAGTVDGVALLGTASPQQQADLQLRDASLRPAGAGRWPALRDYFLLGVHHLLQGYDHLAFLLALVLPLQLRLRAFGGAARDAPSIGATDNWWALLRTVTAFTLGHSVTLVLATLGWTQASAGWVEPVIALSIAITAALNLRPQPWLRVEALALGFGLIHGYGFAGLLVDAAAPDGLLPWALAGFNLGVEAGQLMAVAVWVLVVQSVVDAPWYRRVVLRGGSVLLIALSTVWFWQRVA